MLPLFLSLLILPPPSEAVSLGHFVTGVNVNGEQAFGLSGSMDTQLYVWPYKNSPTSIVKKLKKMSDENRAMNQILLAIVNNSLQDVLSQIAYRGENETSEGARRMLGFVGVKLDHIVRSNGQALAVLVTRQKNQIAIEIIFPNEKLVLRCDYKPTKN